MTAALPKTPEPPSLREAARAFYNATVGDPTVKIRCFEDEAKRDHITKLAANLRVALESKANPEPSPTLHASLSRCGDCRHWMTPKCPREKHSNETGRWRGPASLDLGCEQWTSREALASRAEPPVSTENQIDSMVEKAWDRFEKKAAELALENCRLFAARHRKEEWAATILRFCKEGSATGSPLRAEPPVLEVQGEPTLQDAINALRTAMFKTDVPGAYQHAIVDAFRLALSSKAPVPQSEPTDEQHTPVPIAEEVAIDAALGLTRIRPRLTDSQITDLWKQWPHQAITGAQKAIDFLRFVATRAAVPQSEPTRAQLVADIKDSINELAEGQKFPDLLAAIDTIAAVPQSEPLPSEPVKWEYFDNGLWYNCSATDLRIRAARGETVRRLYEPVAAQDAPELTWVDEDGLSHSMTRDGAIRVLQRLYTEWPGAFEEIEAALARQTGGTP